MLGTAMIFGSNMVLQRQKDIKIWGKSASGTTVTGSFGGIEEAIAETRADEDGNWMLTFPPQDAAKNLTLTITDGADTLSFGNICIGEVWLAGGQSNMEYPLQYDAEGQSVVARSLAHDIRFFDYPEVSYEGQLNEHDYSRVGFWRDCSANDLPYFSAVGYFFAENLQKALDVPVGIIGCNWGGTPACAWIDPEYLKGTEGNAWISSYEEAVRDIDVNAYSRLFREDPMNDRSDPLMRQEGLPGKILYPGLTPEEQTEFLAQFADGQDTIPIPQLGPLSQNRPGGLFEMMLRQVAPYGIRGVIWYQGESDSDKADLYGTVLRSLIGCWRDLWHDRLPFLLVQLPPFGQWLGLSGDRFPEVRKQQELVAKTMPDTWMVSSTDAGMRWDIHPKHKRPIGTRLALLARGHVYGEELLCDPPELLSAERIQEGIRLTFSNGDGLHSDGSRIEGLTVYDGDGNPLIPVAISVVDDGIVVAGEFPDGTRIAFARTGFYEVNLYNGADNPLKPFEVLV